MGKKKERKVFPPTADAGRKRFAKGIRKKTSHNSHMNNIQVMQAPCLRQKKGLRPSSVIRERQKRELWLVM